MDFDKIFVDKFQLKILKLLKSRPHTNYYQIHGYFKFPAFETVLIAVQDLERLGLVCSDTLDKSEFLLTVDGEKYLLFAKQKSNRFKASWGTVFSVLGALASLIAIIGYLSN